MRKAVWLSYEGAYYEVFRLMNLFEKSNVAEDPILHIGQTLNDDQVSELVNREDIDVHIHEQKEVDIWIQGDSSDYRR